MPKYNNPRKTWRYPDEFKSKAVQLTLLPDISVKEVARTLNIHPFMLSRWRKEYREGKIKIDKRVKVSSMTKDKKEISLIKKLEKENLRLKLENDLLKKWQRFLAQEHQSDLHLSKNTGNKSE
jgi:transposase